MSALNSLGQIYSWTSQTRANFEMLDAVRKAGSLQTNLGRVGSAVDGVFNTLKVPIGHMRLLGITGLFGGGGKLAKEYKKPTEDKVARALNIANGIKTISGATASFAKGLSVIPIAQYTSNAYIHTAYKTIVSVASPLAAVSAVFAAVTLASKGYEYYQLRKFFQGWSQSASEVDNRKLAESLQKLSSEEFQKIFRMDKKDVEKDLVEMSQPISKSHRKYTSSKAKIEKRRNLLKDMEARMNFTKALIYSALGSAALSTLGSWISFTSITPTVSLILKNIAVACTNVSNLVQINFKARIMAVKTSIHAYRQFHKQFAELHADWKYGVEAQDFQLREKAFAGLIQLFEKCPPDTIERVFGIKKEFFRETLRNYYFNCHDDQKISILFESLGLRIASNEKMKMVSAALAASLVVAGVCLFIPVTQPAGVVLLVVVLGGGILVARHSKKSKVQLEQALGMRVSKPGVMPKKSPVKRTLAPPVEDYSRYRVRYA